MVMKFFGSKKEEKKEAPPEPKLDMNNREQLREMEKDLKRKLQKEVREIDRAVLKNDMQQKKCENDLKKALKDSNDKAIHAIYAKQVGQCRKMKQRLLLNKVKLNGMMYSIESMFTNMKMAKMMGDTSEVIKQMNGLMNVKELNNTMKDVQKQMMQFGLMNEMVEDAMGAMDEDADVDMDEKDLDQIIDSVKNPEKYKSKEPGMNIAADSNQDADLDDLQSQLNNLA
mmetsp:Transcript_32368/g.37389  ORF Transcript_32368/g.37389 Transcript_32368/m.37389 type:complete len:227 (-) Transcript_32368:38-718(-)|eukprot:CAMPEP_0176446666 /NCGR_PEP_ID=MMETSP0127-20121128/24466_1 /TAXON_ID=938130 /ORGANISM="Platyophrya macrostoma, Strain WH" /LENGTH=226 /DNA_ID=CAMNT_0017832753 /DNA_START=28 /DNA_END=708 /DNA_ORIENTATION=+